MVHNRNLQDVFALCLGIGCELPTRFCILPVNLETATSIEELCYSGPICLSIRSDWLRHGVSESPLEVTKKSFPYRFQQELAGERAATARIFINSPWLVGKPTQVARMLEAVLGRTLASGYPVQFVVRDANSGTANWLIEPDSNPVNVDIVTRRLKRMARGVGQTTMRYGD